MSGNQARPVGRYQGVAPDRVCSRCNNAWPATSAYWPAAGRRGTLSRWCRACAAEVARLHYAKTRGIAASDEHMP